MVVRPFLSQSSMYHVPPMFVAAIMRVSSTTSSECRELAWSCSSALFISMLRSHLRMSSPTMSVIRWLLAA